VPHSIFATRLLGPVARQTLLKFYNLTIEVRTPIYWGKAEIIPILKKGKDPKHPESYTPIALTSIIAKTAEHMINNRHESFLETNCLLTEHQKPASDPTEAP
jgi:hypothetical protein